MNDIYIKGQQTFSIKGQIVNSKDFMGHMAMCLCNNYSTPPCNPKAAIDKTEIRGHGYVLVK